MKFADFNMVYLLWFFCLAIGLYIYYFKKRALLVDKFASKGLLSDLVPDFSVSRLYFKAVLIAGCFFFMILALMRPQWGYELREVTRKGVDIMIALDVSKSMLADDVKPGRLIRAKLAIKDLIKKLQGDRIGLIGFSGDAFLFSPLTVDYSGFLLSLNDLDVNSISKGGTSIGEAINEAIVAYKGAKQKEKILILITDGEDHRGNALEAAKHAKEAGINIYTLGIGTPDGELIKVTDKKGNTVFLKDTDGNVIISRLDEQVLKDIASTTGGAYVHARGADFGLDTIYDTKLSQMDEKDLDSRMERLHYERFHIPLLIAFLLILVETFVSDLKPKARRKD